MTRLIASELQQRLMSTLLWALGVLSLSGLIVAFYPSVRDDRSLNSLYAGLSPAAQGLLGGADLVSPTGYLNTQLFAFFLPAVLLVLGLGRAAAIVAGEEEEHTLDLLLAQPVSRRSAYLQKSMAVVIWLALLVACAWLPLATFDDTVRFHLGVTRLLAGSVQLWLMCVALSMACQAVAAATGRRAIGLAVVVGYTLVSYMVFGLSSSIGWLADLRPMTVWRWYLGNEPLRSGLGVRESIILIIASAAAAALGAELFRRRDLHG